MQRAGEGIAERRLMDVLILRNGDAHSYLYGCCYVPSYLPCLLVALRHCPTYKLVSPMRLDRAAVGPEFVPLYVEKQG